MQSGSYAVQAQVHHALGVSDTTAETEATCGLRATIPQGAANLEQAAMPVYNSGHPSRYVRDTLNGRMKE